MKKFIISLIFIIGTILSSFADSSNIVDFMEYVEHTFKYESDQKQFGVDEYWQTPLEFLLNKRGDCEDFALYIAERLRRCGYRVTTYALLFKFGSGHAINVIWNNRGNAFVTSNKDLVIVLDPTLDTNILIIEKFCKLIYCYSDLIEIDRINPKPIYGKQTIKTYYYNLTAVKKYPEHEQR